MVMRTAEIDPLEARLARIESALDKLPDMLAAFTDAFDELAARVAQTGPSLEERTGGLLELVDVGTRPETTAAITSLARRAPALDHAASIAESVPGGLAALVDVFDELAATAAEQGAELDLAGARVSRAAAAAVAVLGSPELDDGPERLGFFGLLRAMRDPDVQRAMAMAIKLARATGAALRPDGEKDES